MRQLHWNIAEARKRFSRLLDAAGSEPQPIFRRDKLVGAVIGPQEFERYLAWRARQRERPVAEAFDELRRICAEEDYELVLPERADRENPFASP